MNKKTMLTAIIALLVVVVGVFGYFKLINNKSLEQKNATTNSTTNGAIAKNTNTVTDQDVTNMMKSEKDVYFANVAYHPKIVFAVIALKNNGSKEYAQSLKDKYYPILKQKYPNIQMSIQVNNVKGKTLSSKSTENK